MLNAQCTCQQQQQQHHPLLLASQEFFLQVFGKRSFIRQPSSLQVGVGGGGGEGSQLFSAEPVKDCLTVKVLTSFSVRSVKKR